MNQTVVPMKIQVSNLRRVKKDIVSTPDWIRRDGKQMTSTQGHLGTLYPVSRNGGEATVQQIKRGILVQP